MDLLTVPVPLRIDLGTGVSSVLRRPSPPSSVLCRSSTTAVPDTRWTVGRSTFGGVFLHRHDPDSRSPPPTLHRGLSRFSCPRRDPRPPRSRSFRSFRPGPAPTDSSGRTCRLGSMPNPSGVHSVDGRVATESTSPKSLVGTGSRQEPGLSRFRGTGGTTLPFVTTSTGGGGQVESR